MNGIFLQIEKLRQQLQDTVSHYSGNFLHPRVLQMSQELDLLIVQIQQNQQEQQMQHQSKKTGAKS